MKAKRMISAVIALSLTLGIPAFSVGQDQLISFPEISASAADYSSLTFGLRDDGYYKVTGCSDTAETVVIPSEYNGKKVLSVGSYAFENHRNLKKVVIQDGVTSIDFSAFEGCIGLTDITLPKTLSNIGEWAFFRCNKLKEITIPEGSWMSVSGYAFAGCTALESVSIPRTVYSIGKKAFEDCKSLKNIIVASSNGSYKSVGGIILMDIKGTEMIAVAGGADKVTVPDGVTVLQDDILKGFSKLTELTLPDGLTTVGKTAAYDCAGLKEVTIPKSVTEIGSMAFGYYYDTKAVNPYAKIEDFTIYGYVGSAAQDYAKKNEFRFVPLDGVFYSVTLDTKEKTLIEKNSEITVSFDDEAETSVAAENGEFALPALADGSYVMTVDAEGYASREYDVTVKDGKLTEDPEVTLCALGDANNDGKVNSLDIVVIKRDLIKAAPLTGYKKACADTDKNKSIGSLDIIRIKRHIINAKRLW